MPALTAVVEAAGALLGRPPLERYVFMYLETAAGFLSRLEHALGIVTASGRPAHREGLIAIERHQFFHLWNVKRLRRSTSGPSTGPTPAPWIVEGFTEYYTDQPDAAHEQRDPEAYLAGWPATCSSSRPCRPQNMTVEEASWTTWHFGDDRWNGALNYYVRGYLVGVALDLELQARSKA